jgi:penicillin-binding protein 1A
MSVWPPAAASRTSWRSLLRYGIPLLIAAVAGGALGVAVASAIHVPRVGSVEDIRLSGMTELLARDGGRFALFARQRRFPLSESEIPVLLQQAVVAAEDGGFFRHGGVDARGVVRAVLSNLRTGGRTEGASTISMQVARLLYLHPRKEWRRKVEEAFVAVELEKKLSKLQILALYCNLVNLGHGNYGMEAGARGFFGKTAAELTLPEAATLAGIVQRPTAFSPYNNPEGVRRRRNYVLQQMLEEGFIDKARHDEAAASALTPAPRRSEEVIGPYFAEEVRRHLESAYGAAAIYDRGLRVETTLDATMQRAAERAVRASLARLDHRRGWRGPVERIPLAAMRQRQLPSWETWSGEPGGSWVQGIVLESGEHEAEVRIGSRVLRLRAEGIRWTGKRRPAEVVRPGDVAWFRIAPADEDPKIKATEPYLVIEQEPEMEGALVAVESATGAIRALVGGWSYGRSQFDRATQARRQVGSAFKPFVYGAALESGFTAADTLFDAPAVFPGADNRLTYSPRNYHRKYFGIVTLRRALELSLNVATVKLMDLVGIERTVGFARRCGIDEPLPPYPSLALGSADLTPMRLVTAYATIANQGVSLEPYFIERVYAADGETLERHTGVARRAISPQVAYILAALLEGVVDRGTGAALAQLPLDLAGKTGTTDDFSDAWFVGFTPRLTVLTWVGYDQKRSLGRNMTGAEAALPAWKHFVESGLEEGWLRREERFQVPPGIVFESIGRLSGQLVSAESPDSLREAFLEGSQPTTAGDPRLAAVQDLPWYQQRAFYTPRPGEHMPEAIANWEEVEKGWEEGDEDQ